MNHLVLTSLISCLTPLFAISQINVVNQSLTDTSKKIVYVGVENWMLITGTGKFDSIRVVNGLLERINAREYIIKPYAGDSCIVYFSKNNKVVDRKPFTVDKLPEPVPLIGNIQKQWVSLDELLANTKVSIKLPGCYYKHNLIPHSYRFMLLRGKDKDINEEIIYSEWNSYPVLSAKQREMIKNLRSDFTIALDCFSMRSKGDSTRTYIPSVVLHVL